MEHAEKMKAALEYVRNNTCINRDGEWEFKAGYDPQVVLDALFAEDMADGDKMVKVDGVSFRCECGCNVFRNPVGKPKAFVCNACQAHYNGE